ncbi:hypothetical protein [Rhodococcus zopfii]|uniref:hypothetical protein n=1 Tax=Rhodococcus zopfii TaxID=43772 RepID=UPI00093430C7|nr:hypothetical protein [Rhodococcus zopfii]
MRSFAEAWPQKSCNNPLHNFREDTSPCCSTKLTDAGDRNWYAAQAADHGAPLAVANYTYDTLPDPIRELVPTDSELATAVEE